MKRKIILILDGGAMSGIFNGGALSKLEEIGFHDQIEAIYAGSAGATNAAYFLAKQTKEGVNIYFDYLTSNFIYRQNLIPGIFQRLFHKVFNISEQRTINVVDIDYVMDVISDKIPLRVDLLDQQDIGLYMNLLSLKTGKQEWLRAEKGNILNLLRATCCIAPYVFSCQRIKGSDYIDGTIINPIGFREIRKRHPYSKIVIISNGRKGVHGIRHELKSFSEGIIASLMYGRRFLKIFKNREKVSRQEIEWAEKDAGTLLVFAPKESPVRPRTRNKKDLKTTYEMGRSAGEKIVKWTEGSGYY